MVEKIHLYQIFVAIISIFMLYDGVSNFLKGKKSQTILKLFVRIVVWGGMASVALFPRVTFSLARIIGIEGNINAVILTGFILIFLIIFKLLSAIERLEQNLTELVREDSLKNLKLKLK
jgi:hypothetical protein